MKKAITPTPIIFSKYEKRISKKTKRKTRAREKEN